MPLELIEKPRDIKAWERFLEVGMPSKEDDSYRYIHLKELLSHPFHLEAPLNINIEPQINQLVFVNGSYSEALSLPSLLTHRPPPFQSFKNL